MNSHDTPPAADDGGGRWPDAVRRLGAPERRGLTAVLQQVTAGCAERPPRAGRARRAGEASDPRGFQRLQIPITRASLSVTTAISGCKAAPTTRYNRALRGRGSLQVE